MTKASLGYFLLGDLLTQRARIGYSGRTRIPTWQSNATFRAAPADIYKSESASVPWQTVTCLTTGTFQNRQSTYWQNTLGRRTESWEDVWHLNQLLVWRTAMKACGRVTRLWQPQGREELHKESKPDISQNDLSLSLSICKILQLGNAEQIGPARA